MNYIFSLQPRTIVPFVFHVTLQELIGALPTDSVMQYQHLDATVVAGSSVDFQTHAANTLSVFLHESRQSVIEWECLTLSGSVHSLVDFKLTLFALLCF